MCVACFIHIFRFDAFVAPRIYFLYRLSISKKNLYNFLSKLLLRESMSKNDFLFNLSTVSLYLVSTLDSHPRYPFLVSEEPESKRKDVYICQIY